MRRQFLLTALGAALLGSGVPALAQDYPSRLVRVVIPFPAGGPTDAVGRLLAQKLTEQTGQTFLIDNVPGGNGAIGADKVAKAKPDGYTLIFSASTFLTTPLVSKTVGYDAQRDFAPVALVAQGPLAVSVTNGLPVRNVAELISHAKAARENLAFAVGSTASAGHLSTELLAQTGGASLLIVRYKGSAPAYQDLLGGQIQGFVDPLLGALPHHKTGRLRMLAVTSRERVPSLPDVPTVAETLPGFEFYSWYGLWGPPDLPADVTTKLNAEVNRALASGSLRERLLQEGYILSPGTPADFAAYQRDDAERARKIITDARIEPD